MTVGELSDRMSMEEFHRWREFSRDEPFLIDRVDLGGALISSTIVNINRGKNAPPVSISDFMIVHRSMDKKTSEEDREAAHLINTILALGGKVDA